MLLATLRGIGQVMFQRNAATGVLFVLGIAANSIAMAVAAVLGSFAGTALARLGRFPAGEIDDGLYGFNGALVAIAAAYFYPVSVAGVLAGAGGIAVATVLMRAMQKYSLMPLTFPFVASAWAMLWVMVPAGKVAQRAAATGFAPLDGFFQAFGQVMFQANTLTGAAFLVAIAVHSRRGAGVAGLGALAAIIVAALFSWPTDQLAAGLYGYNAVLTAIALSPAAGQVLLPAFGVLLSVALTKAALAAGLPALTFPFILATWIAAGVKRLGSHMLVNRT